jgi:hypothetical protein
MPPTLAPTAGPRTFEAQRIRTQPVAKATPVPYRRADRPAIQARQKDGSSYGQAYQYQPVVSTGGGISLGSIGFELGLAYKLFYPINSSFQENVGMIGGYSGGLGFKDIVLLDVDYWTKAPSQVSNIDNLAYLGSDLSLVYPLRFGEGFLLYLGTGGRFGWIMVNSPLIPAGAQVTFGNNGWMAVAGAKLKFGSLGLDLRYTYDLWASYSGYHTLCLGGFYEFGR